MIATLLGAFLPAIDRSHHGPLPGVLVCADGTRKVMGDNKVAHLGRDDDLREATRTSIAAARDHQPADLRATPDTACDELLMAYAVALGPAPQTQQN